MNPIPFPEPVEGLHFVLDAHEKTGQRVDTLSERAFAVAVAMRLGITHCGHSECQATALHAHHA